MKTLRIVAVIVCSFLGCLQAHADVVEAEASFIPGVTDEGYISCKLISSFQIVHRHETRDFKLNFMTGLYPKPWGRIDLVIQQSGAVKTGVSNVKLMLGKKENQAFPLESHDGGARLDLSFEDGVRAVRQVLQSSNVFLDLGNNEIDATIHLHMVPAMGEVLQDCLHAIEADTKTIDSRIPFSSQIAYLRQLFDQHI